MTRALIAVLAIALGGVARADDEAADHAFRAAQARAAASTPETIDAAIEAYEALGRERPVTRWTDDAWAEAARLAERTGDFARARRALDEVIALDRDPQLVRRARAARDRLAAITGAGQWDDVARQHERLVAEVFDGDDPRAELAALEALVAGHPGYPRADAVRLAIARGWEQEGEAARALRWYRDAAVRSAGGAARLELARALIRHGDLAAATHEVELAARVGGVDPAGLGDVRARLATATRRAWVRRGLTAVLAIVAALSLLVLRRDAGSVRAAARRLVRPPAEVIFLVPIAGVLVAVAAGGNPLVARAVRDIALGGVAIAWLSGVVLDAARTRSGRLAVRRALVHAAAVMVAVGCLAYLAIDRDRLLDLVGETWRGGPNLR